MKKRILSITLPICAAVMVAGAWWADANPSINPPPGPIDVSGRFGTRCGINALPFTIDQCGSYFLTGCLTGTPGMDGITIQADDVTLDLNGFTLIGVPGSGNAVTVQPGQKNTKVENGTVQGWDGSGLILGDLPKVNLCSIDGVGQNGVVVGADALITNCNLSSSGIDGIVANGPGCLIQNVVVGGSSGDGIVAGPGSTVRDCIAHNNARGIEVTDACLIIGNNANNNQGAGIHISGSANTIKENHVANNQFGIEFGFPGNNVAGTGNIVIKNTVTGGPGGVPGNYVFHPLGIQNAYGELLDFESGGGGQINNGNSSHWANFEY